MTKFYKGTNDQVFKAIFCKNTNKDLLEALLEDSLHKKVKVISILQPEIIKDNIFVKGKTLDVLVKDDNNQIINIEVNSKEYKSLNRRNAGYIFSKYAEEVKKGNDYTQMRNFIQINYTSSLPNDKPIKSEYVLADKDTKEQFIDNLTIFEYNIDKIKKMCYDEGMEEYKFIAALGCDKDELEKVCKGDELMEKFEKNINELNEDIEFTTFLTEEEDAIKVQNTLLSEAKDEGKIEGSINEKIEIARNMLSDGLDIDVIIKYTGLSKEEIDSLK